MIVESSGLWIRLTLVTLALSLSVVIGTQHAYAARSNGSEIVDGLSYHPTGQALLTVSVGGLCGRVLSAPTANISVPSSQFEREAVQHPLAEYRERRQFNEPLIQELEENFELFKDQSVSLYLLGPSQELLAMVSLTFAFYDRESMPDPDRLAVEQMGKVQILPAEKVLRARPFNRPLNSHGEGVIAEFRYYYLQKDAEPGLIGDLHFHSLQYFEQVLAQRPGLSDQPIVYTYGSEKAEKMYFKNGYTITTDWSGDGGYAAASDMAQLLVATPRDLATKSLSLHNTAIQILDTRHSDLKQSGLADKLLLNINNQNFEVHRPIYVRQPVDVQLGETEDEMSYIIGFKKNLVIESPSFEGGRVVFDRKPGVVVKNSVGQRKLTLYSGQIASEHKLRLLSGRHILLSAEVGLSLYPSGRVLLATESLTEWSGEENKSSLLLADDLRAQYVFFYENGALAEIEFKDSPKVEFRMNIDGRPVSLMPRSNGGLVVQLNQKGEVTYLGNGHKGFDVRFLDDGSTQQFNQNLGRYIELFEEVSRLGLLSEALPLDGYFEPSLELGL